MVVYVRFQVWSFRTRSLQGCNMNSQVPNTHVHLQISILSLITGFSYFSLKKKFFYDEEIWFKN